MTHVLLTNDDGIDALGIRALYDALSPRFDVTVVAPAENQSWAGRSMTWHAGPTDIEEHELGYAVHGTPSDAVAVGLSVLDLDPDAVVSGVNDGVNLAAHILGRSGTVGAAIEAAHFGVPAVAVSTSDPADPVPPHPDPEAFEVAADAGAFVLERALADDAFTRADYLNVNAPAYADAPEIRLTRPSREYTVEPARVAETEVELEDNGWQGFLAGDPGSDPESDRHAVVNGDVSVTPMRLPRSTAPSVDFDGFSDWR